MLITCPECELQISDKALVCPHCGFPLKKNAQVYPRKANKRRRLPNGFGQISEIKGRNLRKPFRVLVTVDKGLDGKPICKPLQPQSYFETYNDAYLALVEYNKNPYSIEKNITMDELYQAWLKEYRTHVGEKMIEKTECCWRYVRKIHNMKLQQVRIPQLKLALDEATTYKSGNEVELPRSAKGRIKSLFNLMFDYAVENELISQNYARSFALSRSDQEETARVDKSHILYSDEEVELIWGALPVYPYLDITLIQFYSGWRPNELLSMKLEDVDLENKTFHGGSKTVAGKNRIVPIHSKIFHFVEQHYNEAVAAGSEYVFQSDTQPGKAYTYDRYYVRLIEARDALGLDKSHRPHDGRVQFATMAKKAKMDQYALKKILGHYIDDVTEKYYIKPGMDWLRNEIEKIK